jgi:DUF1680 family protein
MPGGLSGLHIPPQAIKATLSTETQRLHQGDDKYLRTKVRVSSSHTSLRVHFLSMSHPQSTFHHTTFAPGSVLFRRRTTVAKTTLHTQLKRLRETGRYDCFKLQWHKIYDDKSMWPVPFHLFWDSDIAKWIEGACYFLHDEFDAEIDDAVKELVQTIRGAQQDDGYLNVHYTVVEPGKRWTNLQDMHEL